MNNEDRIKKALEFVSTNAYDIARDLDKPGKVRLEASMVFLKAECWIAKSEDLPLILQDLNKAIELT